MLPAWRAQFGGTICPPSTLTTNQPTRQTHSTLPNIAEVHHCKVVLTDSFTHTLCCLSVPVVAFIPSFPSPPPQHHSFIPFISFRISSSLIREPSPSLSLCLCVCFYASLFHLSQAVISFSLVIFFFCSRFLLLLNVFIVFILTFLG